MISMADGFSILLIYSYHQQLIHQTKFLTKKEQMLKSLMGKIKSEKSEIKSSSKSQQRGKEEYNETIKYDEARTYAQLSQKMQIVPQIIKIRYIAFEQYPNLYNKIIACPISHFNLLPYSKRKVKEIDLEKDPLPQYILPLKPILERQLPNFNHLLINVYPAGVGIMPHFDGPLYKSKVVVLSLGGPAIIGFSDSYKNTNKAAKLLIEDQSLHIFEQQAYEKYLHGIEDFNVDSIFIKIPEYVQGGDVQIVRSSVANFHLTRLFKIICKKIRENEEQKHLEQIDLSEEMSTSCCLIPIIENEEYNYKIEIIRKQRISITIRQKLKECLQMS